MPDLMACYKGFLIGLEVKTETGKPTELQKRKIQSRFHILEMKSN